MEKKNYQKPSMKVYKIQQPQLLVGSNGGGMNYVPGIPGMPDDEKKLA